jgi:hypothetical protein
MEAAIPAFMRLPILHVDHSERPAGVITSCRVLKSDDSVLQKSSPYFDPDARVGDTYFRAEIPADGDTDDIWGKIEKGLYKKISIYGVRTLASDECKLLPHQRVSPCITKAIRLWSFSLVGDNAINPDSYIKIAKSFSPDLCDSFVENVNELIKAAFPDGTMAPDSDQTGKDIASGDASGEPQVITKAELDPVIQDMTLIKGDMAELKTGISGILDFIKKSVPAESVLEEKVAPSAEDYITKATLEPVLDLIVKAKVDLAVADIKKAYDAKFVEMQEQMKAFGSETIRKGGNTVVLTMDGIPGGSMENPFMANMSALED